MELKNYQKEAVKELLAKSWDLLDKKNGTLVFQSPTGSGKTVIIADLLEQLSKKSKPLKIREKKHALSFVWIAPRKLHKQSKRKLEKYYAKNQVLECKFFDDLSIPKIGEGHEIGEGEILFLNWESVNKEKINNFIKGDEKGKTLDKIVEKTIKARKKIILIVDESHHSASTEIAKKLIKILHPRLSIYVSATPDNRPDDGKIVVHIEDVKKSEMIKKSLVLNEGFDSNMQGKKIMNDFPANKNLKEWVLEKALKKREELAKFFLEEGHNTNPLLLVQLPDNKKGNSYDRVRSEIEAILAKNGITEANGKLAVNFAVEKKNTDNIDWDDDRAEVMLFKQTIALGWDCPRAHVLALFREWSSQTFSIQVLGRIMRIPLPEVGYYDNDILNHAYVYTSHGEIKIDKDFENNDVSLYDSQRKQDYKDIILPSIYREQQRDKTRLEPIFIDIFQKEAEKHGLKDKIVVKGQQIIDNIIEETHLDSVAKTESIKGRFKIKKRSTDDLQDHFNFFIKKNIQPLPPEDVTMARIRSSIYKFLKQECNVLYANSALFSVNKDNTKLNESNYEEDFKKAVAIATNKNNENYFAAVIQSSIEKYLILEEKKEEEFVPQPHWQVPKSIPYGCNYTQENKKKSIIQPFYRYNESSNIEREFIEYLENSTEVIWWFKNGDKGSAYFAVPYKKNRAKHLFHVDFIVMLKTGEIGLYDPKSGYTIDEAKEKHKGLLEYIANTKNVRGGIVTRQLRVHNNAWLIPPSDLQKINQDSLKDWDFLSLSESS